MGNGLAFGTAVALDPALKYLVHVHDPSYFILAFTPIVPTGLMFWLETNQNIHKRFISVTRHVKLNEESNPCNEDDRYEFYACVIDRVTQVAQCRWPWDTKPSPHTSACTHMDQIRTFEEIFSNLTLFGTVGVIINQTGFLAPCLFRKYKLLHGESIYSNSYPKSLTVGFLDNKILIEEEIEAYSGISLVSDIGGALGLFLGFPFSQHKIISQNWFNSS